METQPKNKTSTPARSDQKGSKKSSDRSASVQASAIDTVSDDLVPILALVDEFVSFEGEAKYGNSYLIPFELSNKQRSVVHEHIKQRGCTSESVNLRGSANKKIMIHRSSEMNKPDTKQSETVSSERSVVSDGSGEVAKSGPLPSSEEIDVFANFVGAHFPCPFPEYVEYYIELFDRLYNTREMWELFQRERKVFAIKKEISDTMRKICAHMTSNADYQRLMNTQFKGPGDKMKKDVYNNSSIGKYFFSIDIRSANFTVLRKQCPSIFTSETGELLDWHDFVKLFTKSEFIARSKYFREICFGNTGFIGKAGTLQEIFMHGVHEKIMAWADENKIDFTPRMKAGDENVYELKDHEAFEAKIDSLRGAIGVDTMKHLHIRVFRVDQIETKQFFLKTFTYNTDWYDSEGNLKDVDSRSLKSKIEFKRVPKYFLPQVIRWFNKEKIHPYDLVFIHEGILAEYKATIFD
ncbi:hypothetical protein YASMINEVIRUS_1068 [Yasminevirus sp. GU-2018]|uniref:R3H domain-containing protein n=1 Tax=Yasminevirus sp. GU-2018 TaxID=2420051 RepID=A0A5K0UA47_9VIRU|nr:hypothetical protein YASMINEVIRUS_1068 [Yasminevirus sp. GU-2018]